MLSHSSQRISLCFKKGWETPWEFLPTNPPVQMVLSLPSQWCWNLDQILGSASSGSFIAQKNTWKVAMEIGLCRNQAGVQPGEQVCGDLEWSRGKSPTAPRQQNIIPQKCWDRLRPSWSLEPAKGKVRGGLLSPPQIRAGWQGGGSAAEGFSPGRSI